MVHIFHSSSTFRKRIKSFFKSEKEFMYYGLNEDLNKILVNLKGKKESFYSIRYSRNNYQIYAKMDFGTITLGQGNFSSVNIYLQIERISDREQRVKIISYKREENYIFSFVFFLGLIISISFKNFLLLFILCGMWFVSMIRFIFFYKVQEKLLIEKTQKRLKLKEILKY